MTASADPSIDEIPLDSTYDKLVGVLQHVLTLKLLSIHTSVKALLIYIVDHIKEESTAAWGSRTRCIAQLDDVMLLAHIEVVFSMRRTRMNESCTHVLLDMIASNEGMDAVEEWVLILCIVEVPALDGRHNVVGNGQELCNGGGQARLKKVII